MKTSSRLGATSSACPICGSRMAAFCEASGQVVLTGESFASRKTTESFHPAYLECNECRLLVADVQGVTEETLHQKYQTASFDSTIESMLAAKTYARTLARELSISASVLDVGASDGAFLRECRLRSVPRRAGIEPTSDATRHSNEDVWTGSYLDFSREEKWDLITLFMTVEHLSDPGKFLDWARDRLTETGVVAIAHHDYTAPMNRAFRTRSPIFDIEHLQIFSRRSMKRLLAAHGYSLVRQRVYLNRYPLSYFERLVSTRSAPIGKILRQVVRLSDAQVPAPFGNVMTVARPVLR